MVFAKKYALTLALAIGLLALTACGESGSESKVSYADHFKRANELCKTTHKGLCMARVDADMTVREQIAAEPFLKRDRILKFNDWPAGILDETLPAKSFFITMDIEQHRDILKYYKDKDR
ncbi:hypothetical protein N9J88_04055 [Porticoccaceae bacterium]|nr:hypothetical protein [Porticoccaceae bacterium]